MRILLSVVGVLLAGGGCNCGGNDQDQDPTNVALGDTAIVAVVNPAVNDANSATIPTPGVQRSGVNVAFGDGTSVTSDVDGVAVMTALAAGTSPLRVGSQSVSVTLVDRELREIAVAQSGASASLMADARYPFVGMDIVEIDAGMTVAQVNQALNGSGRIVLVRGGNYQGKVVFNGSNVTLFGEGAKGGKVTFSGDVEVNGSGNRIRGAHVTGKFTVDGSDFAMTFTRVDGAFSLNGSDAILLMNTFCGTTTIAGGNLTALGNAGMAPLSVAPGVCP